MGFDLAAAAAILKENYIGPIREQLNLATPLLAELGRKTEEVVGKRVYVPLHSGRSEAVGARGDGGSLPTADNQSYKESTFNVKYQYGRIKITGPTIAATKNDSGAFLRAVESETKGIMSELKEDFDRQLVSNDVNGRGILAETEAETTQTTIDLQNVVDQNAGRKIRVGQKVDFATGGTVNVSNREITATANDNLDTMTVTISGAAISTTAGDIITRTGSNGKEMVGLKGIVDDAGTLQGVDPSTETYWKSTDLGNGGTKRALSEDLMQQVLDSVAIASGSEPDAIVCDYVQRRKFTNLLTSLKRTVNSLDLKGGFKSITFNDSIPLLLDRFCDSERMYFINRKHLALYEMSDWDWMDRDGAVLNRVDGEDAYEATLFKYCELGTDKRNAHGVLKDLVNT